MLKVMVCQFFWLAVGAQAEMRTLTLRESVALALKQNPDIVIARYEQAKARFGVQIARDPFVPKLYGGSGAAYTNGYPAAINGQPPSIFEARTIMSLYNRPQTYKVAEAREGTRTAELELGRQQDDVAWRAAVLWLDARQSAESAAVAGRQLDSLRKVKDTVEARLSEGRALPIDSKRAAFDLARGEQRVTGLADDLESAERALAVVLGFPAEDRVRAAEEDPIASQTAVQSEDAAVESSIENSKELRVLESRIQIKRLELREYKSARWPVVDLVAQYSLLAKYNFQDYFPTRFQRHNGEIGASITVPLLVGSAPRAYLGQTDADLGKLQTQASQARSRIALDTRKGYVQVRKADAARNVAKLDLELAREQVNVLLAQQEEGRASLKDVEQARIQETEKWMAYYDAQHVLDRVKLDLMRQTGTLVAALQ